MCMQDFIKSPDSAGKHVPFALPLPPPCFLGHRHDDWTLVAILDYEVILRMKISARMIMKTDGRSLDSC